MIQVQIGQSPDPTESESPRSFLCFDTPEPAGSTQVLKLVINLELNIMPTYFRANLVQCYTSIYSLCCHWVSEQEVSQEGTLLTSNSQCSYVTLLAKWLS